MAREVRRLSSRFSHTASTLSDGDDLSANEYSDDADSIDTTSSGGSTFGVLGHNEDGPCTRARDTGRKWASANVRPGVSSTKVSGGERRFSGEHAKADGDSGAGGAATPFRTRVQMAGQRFGRREEPPSARRQMHRQQSHTGVGEATMSATRSGFQSPEPAAPRGVSRTPMRAARVGV